MERNLGEPLRATDQRFRVSIEQDNEGWHATIDVQSEAGALHRSLPAVQSCLDATEAAALIVAMALTSASEPAPEPTEPAEPDPETTELLRSEPPPPPPQPEPAPPSPTQRPAAALLGILAGARWGVLDAATADLVLHGALLWKRFRVFADGTFVPPRTIEAGSSRVRFVHWSAAAGACARVRLATSLQLEPCVAFEAGQLFARPQNLGRSSDATQPWFAGRAGAGLAWAFVTRVALVTRIDGFVPLSRARFQVSGTQIARPTLVGVRGITGFEFRFGAPL